jgi:hypothetical protein
MKSRLLKVGGVLVSVAAPCSAFAEGVTVDYSAAVTGITGQITTALTAALPVMGIILGIYVGVKVFKRFAK